MKWTTDEFTGKRFGKYEVLCRLAVGGMAEIFLGFAHAGPYAGRPVVLKRILAEQREDPAALQMLIDEAKLTATLNHPNVAQVLDLETDADDVLLVIEFISGANLEEVVAACSQRGEGVPLGFALAVICEAAEGLATAHGHQASSGGAVPIVHRDVTPRNVMVNFDGAIKVLDFGIARAKGSARRTQAGMVRGTTAYMSPEQAVGKELDPRSDLFSLGVIAHELLTGARLFYRGHPAQEMAAVYEGDIPLPSKVNRRVPKAVDPVVMKALERKVDRRYQSALELTRDLALAAGSATWPRERSAELVRMHFIERQRETDRLLARIPVGDLLPEGPTQIGRGGLPRAFEEDDDAPPTIFAGGSVIGWPPKGGPPPPPPATDEPREPLAPVPVPETITDTRPLLPAAPEADPATAPSLDVARWAAVPAPGEAAPSTSASTRLALAAAVALALGGLGGAALFKSTQQPAGTLVPVSLSTDRVVEVFYGGRSLGPAPLRALFPVGRHVLELGAGDAGLRRFEFEASEGANSFDVALDSLQQLP
jgi:serine/threonine protein kinase